MSYSKKRYLTYLFFTIFTFTLPFITIDGNHMLLLSFVKMEFHFLGNVYDTQELFIMPFLLMFLFIGIFAITSIMGRIWCGWACPQTIFRVIYRDLIETYIFKLRRIKNKQKDIDYEKRENQIKKYLSLFIFTIITFIISVNFMWYFVPPEDFFLYLKEPLEHTFLWLFILGTMLFLIYDIVFMKENFCTYVCPYSRIQSTLYDDNTTQIVYDENRGGKIYDRDKKLVFSPKDLSNNFDCTACEACVKICPTHIDIRKGLQVECINCLECSDACETVMGKLGKPSLIKWGSTNNVINKKKISFWSVKNTTYLIVLVITIIFASYYGTHKQPFLASINKTTQLYRITEDGYVRNNYILTIENSLPQNITYDVRMLDEDYKIINFKPFELAKGQRVRKIVIIETKPDKRLSDIKDVPLRLKLEVYSPKNQDIKKDIPISFVYPKNSILK